MKEMYDAILETHVKAKKKNLISGTASDRFHLFTTLRKVANHPLLLRNRYTSDEDIHHLAYHLRMYGYFGQAESCTLELVKREVRTMSDFHIHHAALDVIDEHKSRRKEMERYILSESDLFSSPKLDTLRTRIPELVEKGHRILIFSQWTNCLDLLGCLLETLGMTFFRLDGQTPISTRQDLIDKFNRDVTIPVFLLSTKAGGMGTLMCICSELNLPWRCFSSIISAICY
jgi:SWI/SNF-related matrix-associated actin-dependent regulator of chromatin subfamily A containing DEAD/H box 1